MVMAMPHNPREKIDFNWLENYIEAAKLMQRVLTMHYSSLLNQPWEMNDRVTTSLDDGAKSTLHDIFLSDFY